MAGGKVSSRDLIKLIHYQIDEGIDGLVPVGTTGESPTLSHEEHAEVIRCVVRVGVPGVRAELRVRRHAGQGRTLAEEVCRRHVAADCCIATEP